MKKLLEMFKDDTTKQWSFVRISAALVIVYHLGFAAYIAFTTKVLPDIPENWLIYVVTAYGLHKYACIAKEAITTYAVKQPGDKPAGAE